MFQLFIPFFGQHLNSIEFNDGRTVASWQFENLIKEDVELLYAFKGAFTYQDLNNMTDYEIMLISEAYKDIKETEKIIMERTKENQGKTEIVNNIVLPNSRFNMPEEFKE